MFYSRHSSGGADQLLLSTILSTLDSGHSPLPGITEYEMPLCRWDFRPNNIKDMLKDNWSVSEQILTQFLVKQWNLTHSHTFFRTSPFQS
jgi:hypothetical protein